MKKIDNSNNDKFYIDRYTAAKTYYVFDKNLNVIDNRNKASLKSTMHCKTKNNIIASIDNKHRLHLYNHWDENYLHRKHIQWFTGHTVNELKELIENNSSSIIVKYHKHFIVNKYGILRERSTVQV